MPEEEVSSKWPLWRKGSDPPLEVTQAWTLYCRGTKNWSAIARVMGYDNVDTTRRKVRRDVARYSRALLVSSDDDVDPLGEAVGKLEQQERELWRIHQEASQDADEARAQKKFKERDMQVRVKLWALRQMNDVVMDVAKLRGVVTDTASVNLGGQVAIIEQFGEDDHGAGNHAAADVDDTQAEG